MYWACKSEGLRVTRRICHLMKKGLLPRLCCLAIILLTGASSQGSSEEEGLSSSSKSALNNAAQKIDRLRDEILADLQNHLVRATKNGRLDEALALKEEIRQLSLRLNYSSSSNVPWVSGSVSKPFGGKVELKFPNVSLQGPGTGPTQNAVAIFRATFGAIWATFYSNIWSHCSQPR